MAWIPLADPIIGLVSIVWQSAKAVLTRMLDGIEPHKHAPGIQFHEAKARWLGHRLRAEIVVSVDPTLSVADAIGMAAVLKKALRKHMPALSEAPISLVEQP